MFPSFHSLGTKPWHIDELNIIVIGFDIVELSSFRTKILEKGGKIDSLYMDFMKAFDKVPHRRLLHKIHRYKISEKVIK
jgi:phosphopantetheinyl transferase (holo-ACP synthase)